MRKKKTILHTSTGTSTILYPGIAILILDSPSCLAKMKFLESYAIISFLLVRAPGFLLSWCCVPQSRLTEARQLLAWLADSRTSRLPT